MKSLIFFIGLFLLACAGSKEIIQEDVGSEIVLVYDESFDPLSLEDDDIVIGMESKAADSDRETFEAPLYKIRVGDCKTRQDADNVRDLAKKYGYAEAFLVKSKIIISENN